MTNTFFDSSIHPSATFEATLREQVIKAGISSNNWLWYLVGSLSFASVCAFIFIPYFSFSLNFFLLDTLI